MMEESSEIKEMRAHKARIAAIDKEIHQEVVALRERLSSKGYMFMAVVADKRGLVVQTVCWGPAGAYSRLLSTLADSACKILNSNVELFKRKLREHGIAEDGEYEDRSE